MKVRFTLVIDCDVPVQLNWETWGGVWSGSTSMILNCAVLSDAQARSAAGRSEHDVDIFIVIVPGVGEDRDLDRAGRLARGERERAGQSATKSSPGVALTATVWY